MNTHTIHRHFVAVPIMLIVFFSLIGGERYIFASATDHSDESRQYDEFFETTLGVSGQLSEDGSLTLDENGVDIILHTGDVRLKSARYASVIVQDVSVDFFAGAASILSDGATLTVVAIDTPVRVITRTKTHIVPATYQLRLAPDEDDPSVTSVPSVWLREEEGNVLSLPDTSVDPVLAMRNALLPNKITLDAEQKRRLLISLHQHAFAKEDLVSLLGMLSFQDLSVTDARTVMKVARLLGGDDLEALLGIRLAFDRHLPGSSDVLAASLSRVRNVSMWSFALAATADLVSHPLDDVFVYAWLDLTKRSAASDAYGTFQKNISIVNDVFVSFEKRNYPRYLALWQKNMREFLSFADPLLAMQFDEQTRDIFEEARLHVLSIDDAEMETVAVQSQSKSEDAAYNEAWATFQTRSVLNSGGALFTVHTQVTALKPSHRYVQVTGLLFATEDGELSFDFTYDVALSEVGNIVRNGKRLPNALSLDRFLASF